MECRSCGRSLPDDARFCPGCGAAVVTACAACGTELEPDARFCRRCGQPVAGPSAGSPVEPETAARGAAREAGRERKVATLLFADIVGFTGFAVAHDPELV
jgi:class 3 adenylate cyclase